MVIENVNLIAGLREEMSRMGVIMNYKDGDNSVKLKVSCLNSLESAVRKVQNTFISLGKDVSIKVTIPEKGWEL